MLTPIASISLSDPTKWTVFEIYKDEQALTEHQATAHFQKFVTFAGDAMEGGFDSAVVEKARLVIEE
jgi:quinol monooxygenase YgiN